MKYFKSKILTICLFSLVFSIGLLLINCDRCKYTKYNPILLDYANVTFSLYIITENHHIMDYFAENSGHSPDSIKLYNIDHEPIALQRTPNKNEFTFYFIDSKVKKKIFDNIIVKYYYLNLNSFDTDTIKIEMKGQYIGNCDNESFELMRVFYNNTMVLNGASKGQTNFGFRYNKK